MIHVFETMILKLCHYTSKYNQALISNNLKSIIYIDNKYFRIDN